MACSMDGPKLDAAAAWCVWRPHGGRADGAGDRRVGRRAGDGLAAQPREDAADGALGDHGPAGTGDTDPTPPEPPAKRVGCTFCPSKDRSTCSVVVQRVALGPAAAWLATWCLVAACASAVGMPARQSCDDVSSELDRLRSLSCDVTHDHVEALYNVCLLQI